MLNFGSSKQVNPETGNSLLSLLSVPPSLLQCDFHYQTNLKSSIGNTHPSQSSLGNVTATGNWPLLHGNGNLNLRDGKEIHPVFPCKPPICPTNGRSHGISDDLDSLRAFVNHTNFRKESGHSNSFQKGLSCSPSSSHTDEFHAFTNNAILEASLQRMQTSSTSNKQPSIVSGCPRVFCMDACGNLLLSNTGLFGIICTCHGTRMSVLKFCEHSGLVDINPGYAVRMESGECITQWRKVYLQKFGITAPEDHKGWEWPEGSIPPSHLADHKMAVADRKKVFDLSSLFTSSAESTKSSQTWNSMSSNRTRSSEEFANQVLKAAQNYDFNQCATRMSLTANSGGHSHTIPEEPVRACSPRSCFTTSKATGKEKLQTGSQISSFNLNIHHSRETPPGSAIQTSQSIDSKTHRNLQDGTVMWRGNLPSIIELKLGQPSLGLVSTFSSALKPCFSDFRAIAVQEKLTSNRGNSKVAVIRRQHNHHRTASEWSRTKEHMQPDLLDNPPGIESDISHVVSLKNGLANSSTVPVRISSSITSGESVMFHKESSKPIIDSHSLIPSALRYQPNVGISSPIDVSCYGNRSIRPLDSSKVALQMNKNRTVGAIEGNNLGHGSSFKLYDKQMENYGFLTRYDSHPNAGGMLVEEICSVGMPSLLSGISGPSTFPGDTFNLRSYPDEDRFANVSKTSSTDSGLNPTLQTVPNTLQTTVLPLGHGSSFKKGVDSPSTVMCGERLRVLASKNMKESVNKNSEHASFESNQQTRTNSDQQQQCKNYIFSDLGVPKSFLSRRPLQGQGEQHRLPVEHSTAPIILSDVSHGEGTNSLGIFGASTQKTADNNQGPCHPPPEQRCQNKDFNCTVLQSGFQELYTSDLTDTRNRTVQMTCANGKTYSESSASVNAVQRQVSSVTIGTPKLSLPKPADESVPLQKEKLVVCNQKGNEQMHCKLDCFTSQWRDVPSRTAAGTKRRRCLDAPTDFSETRLDSVAHLNNLSGKGIAISTNQVTDLLDGKEISISSRRSVPAITETSCEVNKNDSFTFNGGFTGYANDQVVDQGSAIMRSCSFGETINSVRSSQAVSDAEAMLTEIVSPIITFRGQNDEFGQLNLKLNELQYLDFSGASLDDRQEHVDKFQTRKRKRDINWSMLGTSLSAVGVSLSPTKYKLPADTDVGHHTHISEGAQSLNGDLNGHGLKKRRSTLCQVKLHSRKRNLRGRRDFVDGEQNDQRLLKGSDPSFDFPVDTTFKKWKSNCDHALKKKVNSTKDLKAICLHKPNADETSRCGLESYKKSKPVACGKYGILCEQELDIDQMKPPKIVPLSHILKVSERCTKFEKESTAFSEGKKWSDESSQRNKLLSCKDGDSSIHENQPMHSPGKEHSDGDLSALEEVGASGSISNPLLSILPAGHIKTKEIRMRNLYELSMKGNKFIAADLSLSQNVMCAPPQRNLTDNAGECGGFECRAYDARRSFERRHCQSLILDGDALCCVCGISNKDDFNCLLECGRCLIRIHQACYGISRVPKGKWFCRPCRTNSKDVVCVLCGYGGGAMTRGFGSRNVVKTLLKAWNIRTESHIVIIGSAEPFDANREAGNNLENSTTLSSPLIEPVVHNCIIAGLFNPTVKQWVHMVCGLWTPGTRCPNVDTMSAFDVSGVYYPNAYVVCYICKRSGGSCIKCRIETCCAHFHPWCAHQKGLLQSEVEGVDKDKVGFYGRCLLHASYVTCISEDENDINRVVFDTGQDQEPTCARTEAYQGKTQEGRWPRSSHAHNGKGGCLVTQVQLDAWLYINRHKLDMRRKPNPPISDVEHDYRKEYARFTLAKGWKHLVVYKSGIHALGLYTSQFLPRGAMVVEYVGEIVGQHVADKRETEYLAGRKLQYKSACYFFRIDKEHIIDATCKGGIARFVNHSCQPNSIAKVITIKSQKKVVFFAQKDIFPGEEITYDYHFTHEDEGKKIPCFCNAENCRRYLN